MSRIPRNVLDTDGVESQHHLLFLVVLQDPVTIIFRGFFDILDELGGIILDVICEPPGSRKI